MTQAEVPGHGSEEGQEDKVAYAEGEAEREAESWEPHEQVAQEIAEDGRASVRSSLDEGLGRAGEEAVGVRGGDDAGYEEGSRPAR